MRSGVLLAAVAIAVAVLSTASGATPRPTFAPAQQVATFHAAPANLQEIGTADLNGDGRADIIETRLDPANPKPTPVTVLAGDGKGHFSDVTAQIFQGAPPAPVFPRRTLFADFNGDGRTDVFIADTGPDSLPFPGWPNTLILSAPGGKLVDASANLPREPDFTHSAAAADVDGNGTVDLYAGNLSGPVTVARSEILLNDGTGHFRIAANALPADITAQYSPHYDGGAFADVNGDGYPDLVLAGAPTFPDRLLINDRTGHFTDSPVALPAKPWGTDNSEGLDVKPLDVNADGHMDLLVAFTKNVPFYKGRWLQVLINNGDGTFKDDTAARLPQTDNGGEWPYSIQVADVNGDGKPDLGFSLWWYPTEPPDFYVNQGDGTFSKLSDPTLEQVSPSFVFIDANGDHHVDVYSVQAGFDEAHFLTLQKAPPVVKPKPKPKQLPRCKRRPKPRGCKRA